MLDSRAVERLFVGPSTTIRETTRRLDAGGKGIALVIDDGRRLLGTVTDGDIRRAMLAGIGFDQPVTVLLERKEPRYRSPFRAHRHTSREEMLRLMREQVIRQLPIVDADGTVVGLVTIDELLPEDQPVEALICPNGEHWKHGLLPLGNRPLLATVIERLRQAGIDQVRVVGEVDSSGSVREALCDELRLEDASAGKHSSDANGKPGAGTDSLQVVIGAPILTRMDFRSLVQFHREHHADMTIAVRPIDANPHEQLVDVAGSNIIGLPRSNATRFVDAGIYVLGPKAQGHAATLGLKDPREIARELLRHHATVVSFPIREYWATVRSLEDYHQVLADNRRGLIDCTFQYEPGTPSPAGTVPLCVPEIRGNEWSYIKECLDTNWVSSVGPFVDSFEAAFANYLGARHAVATCNGTSAIHIALILAGVRPGDEVLVSSLSFIAPANAIRYVGAIPRFIDSEPNYWQMDAEMVAQFLHNDCHRVDGAVFNRITGRRVAAILPVHILGHPCDMDRLMELAKEFNLPVIEDATESLGASYRGAPIGTLGLLACFSFNGNKLITTGGGGMIVTQDESLARRAKYLTTQAKDDPIEFVHGEVGFNYRLTNVQAAMGCAQLEQIDDFLARKKQIAERYDNALGQIPGIEPMREAPWAKHAWWLYTVRIQREKFGMSSRELLRHLATRGIQTRPLWQPLHRSPAHRSVADEISLPTTEEIHAEALSLPCSVGLSNEDLDRVIYEIQMAAEHSDRIHRQTNPVARND